MLYVAAAAVLLVLGFVWWRYTSVGRGAAARDAILYERLEPLEKSLEHKNEIQAAEVRDLARMGQYRPFLYNMLKHFEHLDLFPPELTTPEELVDWFIGVTTGRSRGIPNG